MSEHDKHRRRMDRRVYENGLEMLEPHEQLEHLLYAVIPRGDTNALAHRILKTYGSISAVFNAEPEDLEEIYGVGHRTAMFLTTMPSLLGIVERYTKFDDAVRLETTREKVDYIKTYFYGKMTESAYMFSLNSSNRLLHTTRISEGVAGETAVFVPKVVKQALCDNAVSVVLAHNHPQGVVNPSQSDFDITRRIYRAFKATGIYLADCIIISGDDYFSMRDLGYLDPAFMEEKQ